MKIMFKNMEKKHKNETISNTKKSQIKKNI